MSETKINRLLPFDVLSYIFLYYVEDETLDFPLETLLLVCRFWNAVALRHKQIWSILNVKIENE